MPMTTSDDLNARTVGGITRSLDTLDSGLEEVLGAYTQLRETTFLLVERLAPVLHDADPHDALLAGERVSAAAASPLQASIDSRAARAFALAESVREVEQIVRGTIDRLEL